MNEIPEIIKEPKPETEEKEEIGFGPQPESETNAPTFETNTSEKIDVDKFIKDNEQNFTKTIAL